MDDGRLWTPPKVLPTERKRDGGSYFDDEMSDTEVERKQFLDMATDMVEHIRQRPDHTIYVGGVEDRTKMRQVLNHFYTKGLITTRPRIKIDYGVPDGTIRIDEDR